MNNWALLVSSLFCIFFQGIEGIKGEIESAMVSHRALQPQRYTLPSSITRFEGEILESLEKEKMLEFSKLVDSLSGISGKAALTLLKEMHSQVYSLLEVQKMQRMFYTTR